MQKLWNKQLVRDAFSSKSFRGFLLALAVSIFLWISLGLFVWYRLVN